MSEANIQIDINHVTFHFIRGDDSYSKWEASKNLYEVVTKAVDSNRDQCYPSVEEFYSAWSKAKQNM